jgi:hypothetical protein
VKALTNVAHLDRESDRLEDNTHETARKAESPATVADDMQELVV